MTALFIATLAQVPAGAYVTAAGTALVTVAVAVVLNPFGEASVLAGHSRVRTGGSRQWAPTDNTQPGSAVTALMPTLSVHEAQHRALSFGIARDHHGWFSLLEVEPERGMSGHRSVEVSMGRLARLLTDDTLPITSIQLVATSVPVLGQLDGSPAAQSYAALAHGSAALAAHATYAAVRFGNEQAARAAAARGGGRAGLERALGAALGRVAAAFTEDGHPSAPLSSEQLRTALADAVFPDGTVPPSAVRDHGKHWIAGELAHRTWQLRNGAALPLGEVHDRLVTTGCRTAATSATMRRSTHGGDPTVQVLVRVAVHPTALETVSQHVVAQLRQVGAELRSLAGQADAVYASAPTGSELS
ncbi:type VII secretion protein EccE [Catellatospora tritici]|uniref:type VII secretion protein EccE n=1 Tax=Catellatospora tritici TaxID=2851566 RepID=UPI001C2CECDE|nr:type VII secretion protein EccE [Catellatospora tritici]MBV1853547.1 hypothetical protein [Catellatospora tritici]